jgi:hypothetical protein
MYKTQHRNALHKTLSPCTPNTHNTTQKTWVTFTLNSPLVWTLTNLFCNANLKIVFWSMNTIHKLLCTQTNNTSTKHQSGIYQMKCQTCKHSQIGKTRHKFEVDTKSTFTVSRLTTHSQLTPITFLTVHMNLDPLMLQWHYYNQYKEAGIWVYWRIISFNYSNVIIWS